MLGIVAGVLVLGALVWMGSEEPRLLGATPLILPNLALLVLALGSTGGVHGGAGLMGVGADRAFHVWDVGGGAWLLVAAVLLAAAVLSLRLGVRRARTGTPQWNRVWQLPLATLAVWVVLLLAGLMVNMNAARGFGAMLSLSPSAWAYLSLPLVVLLGSGTGCLLGRTGRDRPLGAGSPDGAYRRAARTGDSWAGACRCLAGRARRITAVA